MDILRLCRSHYERLPFNMQKRFRSRICRIMARRTRRRGRFPPHVLDMGSPELSELGDTASFRDEPIHIEFSAKEPSAEDRRFADVIRFKLACEADLKMYGDSEEFREQVTETKRE